MKVQVINKSKHQLPQYATGQSAGMDIRANLDEPIVLKPLQRCLVPTGLYIALPKGFEAQIRPRSGLALKKGIGVLNSPGTIDADYRGEVGLSRGDAELRDVRYPELDWQHLLGHFSQRVSPANLNSTGLM